MQHVFRNYGVMNNWDAKREIMTVSKYRAVRTVVDGITFASKKEAARYKELKLLEKAGKIKDLVLQFSYPLEINGTLICRYRADFIYLTPATFGHSRVVEDCKGFKTPIYKLKKKLMKAIYGIDILET